MTPPAPSPMLHMQVLRQTGGQSHGGSGSSPGKKHAEAKVVLQLAGWMAATGQGGKTDITGDCCAASHIRSACWIADSPRGHISFTLYIGNWHKIACNDLSE